MYTVSCNSFSYFLQFHFPLGLYVIKCFTAIVFHSRLTFLHEKYAVSHDSYKMRFQEGDSEATLKYFYNLSHYQWNI